MIVLDTNVIIRYLVKDDEIRAEKAKLLLEQGKELVIPDVVLPEIEYVLRKLSKATHRELIKTFKFLKSLRNIHLTKEARDAIAIFDKSKLDMADCIVAAYSMKGSLASFDKDLLGLGGINPFWK